MIPNSTSSYHSALSHFQNLIVGLYVTFIPSVEVCSTCWTQDSRTNVYSAARWGIVKQWELNQVNGLEAMPQVPYGSYAPEHAAWYLPSSFLTSPNILHISAGPGLGNGSAVAQAYLSYIWYVLELILNDGNGTQHGSSPIDYPYVTSYLESSNGVQRLNEYMLWQWKALQTNTLWNTITHRDPSYGSSGWPWQYDSPYTITDNTWRGVTGSLTDSQIVALVQPYLQAWYNQASSYTAAQYCAGGWLQFTGGATCATNNNQSNVQPSTLSPVYLGGALWDMLHWYNTIGVSSTLITNLQNFGASLYPLGNWSADQ
jgi:hypothetical protein